MTTSPSKGWDQPLCKPHFDEFVSKLRINESISFTKISIGEVHKTCSIESCFKASRFTIHHKEILA